MKATRPFEILVYQTTVGRQPFTEWTEQLESPVRQIVRGRIARVQNGLLGDCKSVGAGVFELRIKTGPGFRVYFGIDNGRVVILLCAGDKSSQPFDIKLARKYWKDWEERS